MPIGPTAVIDHAALRHNLGLVRRHAPSSKVWAVIKADAYGHGMARTAASLSGADGFAVARIAEAVLLREAGATRPILVLAGALAADEMQEAARLDLDLALHQGGQLELLERIEAERPLRVWIKVDTGMHRLGFQPEEVPPVLERLRACAAVRSPPGLMTHLANADDPADPLSQQQCDRLRSLARPGQALNIGNSGGILSCPAARTDWVRPGIMLYGSSPFGKGNAGALGLRPAMTLKTRLVAVRRLRRNDRVGYGGTYSCPEDMPVGVAAIGYGDGYPRHAPTGTPVLVGGVRAPLAGRVSMDTITLDLRGAPAAAPGDEVILWGGELPAEEIASRAGTISYELFCGVSGRVPRHHVASSPASACHPPAESAPGPSDL
jgi:alanine racemase